jgi:hypothetical protein
MNEYLRAWRREGGFVVIKGSVELGFYRESWVDAGCAHEVQCLCALVDETAPQVHWEVGVQTGKSSHKMIFPNSDYSFGGVLAMIVRGDKLEVNVGFAHKLFESR